MMTAMMPMKMRAPRIPPITAPVEGPGVICLFSSGVGERHRQGRKTKTKREKRENVISNSFEFHVTASGTLMLLTCNICIFTCFAAEVSVNTEKNSLWLCESAVFHS